MDARDLWALLHHCTKAGMIVMKSLGGLGNTSGNHKYRLKLYHVNMMVKHRHHFWAKAHFKQTEAKWKLFCGQRNQQKGFSRSKRFGVLNRPACSPDLSLIWSIMK